MTRNFKALGLALVAAFAMSAVFAAGAQALEAEVEGGGTATVTAVPIEHNGTTHHSFTTFFGSITCNQTLFEGTVTNGATTLTVTPTYSECEVGGRPVTITHNGCNYKFHGGSQDKADHFVGVEVDLECPEGVTGIAIHVYSDGAHTKLVCTYVVHPFTNKKENTVENTTSASPKKDIDVTSTVEGVAVKRTFGGFLSCGSENQSSTYTGGTTLRAYSDEAHTNQIGIAVK